MSVGITDKDSLYNVASSLLPKYRPVEETQHHVYDLVLETREKPLTVMVDGDSDVLIENVIR